MALQYQESDPILLGSGELYICESKLIEDLANLTEEEEAQLVNVGAIESGATITISSEWEDITADNRGKIARMKGNTDVILSTGVMTWKMENMAKFLLGAEYTEDAVNKTRKMVLSDNNMPPACYIRFIHNKKDGGQLMVNMYKGLFNGDLELNFSKKNPTTVNYSFTALADSLLTNKSNYVEFIETFKDTPTA